MEPNTTHSTDLYNLTKHTKKPTDSSLFLISRHLDPHARQVWEVTAKLSPIIAPKAHHLLPLIHLGQSTEPIWASF